MKGILSIRQLSIGYKQTSIIRDINFHLDQGQLCGIVGVNGIGKSTLLRTMANLQPKLAGDVLLEGTSLEALSPLQLAKKLALVLTEPPATKNLSVQELIALARQPYTNWLGSLTKKDHQKTEETIQYFQLEALRHKKCFELSDGQLQQVLIARAMAQDTSLIFLDEPTTHLDLSNKVQVFKRLAQLAHQHQKTVLFTTHEIELAIQMCDKILILDGNENPFGSPSELIENGCFDSLFPSDVVQFDAKTGTFKVNKNSTIISNRVGDEREKSP